MSDTFVSSDPARKIVIVPLQAEQIAVTRESVEGDTVRVETVTNQHEHAVDEVVFKETVEVTHVPIGREVTTAPEITRDGDLTIIPVMEEIMVVSRKLILKEEIHLRRVRVAARHQETVLLRKQEAVVTRAPSSSGNLPVNSDIHQGEQA